MKKPTHQILLGSIVLTATSSLSYAAIGFSGPIFGGAPASESWTTLPATNPGFETAEWSQYVGAGAEASITDLAGLTAAVNAISHGDIPVANIPSSSSTDTFDWVSRNAAVRYNTTNDNIQFAQGDQSFHFLQARARNTSGFLIQGVTLAYDYSQHTPSGWGGDLADNGLKVYYSTDSTGSAGTWNLISSLSIDTASEISLGQSTFMQATIDLSGLPGGGLGNNENIFFRWADQNAFGDDRQYFMDNNSFTAVPEPSTGLLSLIAVSAITLRRRRQK